jgi:hypothetical protein
MGVTQGCWLGEAGSDRGLLGITVSLQLWGIRYRDGGCGEHGVLVKQGTEREEGVDAQVRLAGLAHGLAGERIEHPRGDGNL